MSQNIKRLVMNVLLVSFVFASIRSESIGISPDPSVASQKRLKRHLSLLFINPSAITFICGFGIPINNLNPELVTVGMVFKAQYFLPAKYKDLTTLSTQHIHKRHTSKSERVKEKENLQHKWSFKNGNNSEETPENHRILFYKTLEVLSESLGQPGRQCVLKMICDVATMSFHYGNGVLGDLLYILLSPSSSQDVYPSPKEYEYIRAEEMGRSGLECREIYGKCKVSILDRLTNIFD